RAADPQGRSERHHRQGRCALQESAAPSLRKCETMKTDKKQNWLPMHLIKRLVLVLLLGSCLCGCGGGKGMHGDFAVSVVAEPVKEEKIENKISLVGNLAADEAVEIKNQISGVIEVIGFQEGQAVKKDDMIFKIDAGKMNATLAQAQANLGLAKTTYERLASLIDAGAISQQEFDQAKSDLDAKKAELDLMKAQLKETDLTAPFDRVMGERMVSLGQYVNQGTTLTFLISQDPMKAEFRVPERFLGQLKENQAIEVTVAAYPTETFQGKVYF